MAINLELPGKMLAVLDKAHQGAAEMMHERAGFMVISALAVSASIPPRSST